MTAPTYTDEDVARLLSCALERFVAANDGDRVYSLDEVAAKTGMSRKAIMEDCRAGRAEHVHRGNLRGMTSRQIRILVNRHSTGGDLSPAEPDDELTEARRASARSGARRQSRRVA